MQALDSLSNRINDSVFQALYRRSLVYNTCWEDPAVDRLALNLNENDTILAITSAGCNVLDYALTGPRRIYAVDANPRQTALLELKLAGIRSLDYADFFKLFGEGRHAEFPALYRELLRHQLSGFAQRYWDQNGRWFHKKSDGDTFYFHGLSGRVAKAFNAYRSLRPRLRKGIEAMLGAESVEEQRIIYDACVRPLLWSPQMNWVLSRQLTMNLLGVPHPQRHQIENQHHAGVAGFIRESIEYVFRQIPLWLNYFWTVYLTGSYARDCCPEYLEKENFHALQQGAADCIHAYTCTVTEFLQGTNERISKFVLLDHMDWMSTYHPGALTEEWRAIFDKAAEGARVIFRSAHAQPAYLSGVVLDDGAERVPVTERVRFHPELAADLQRRDRVHTYAGFHIADLLA